MIGKRIETQEVSVAYGKQPCGSILLQAVQCSGSFNVWAILVFVFGIASSDRIKDCLGYAKSLASELVELWPCLSVMQG